ncbi:uncharacterized protein LOC133200532 [Saccostrea echinata]|uniref:uncharacterized protein LOC133200532 n=1 Tax=Saccostrea echinata TaxID=191078 RepID=UPI002A828A8D|nr:uncharacterized protein LOC133200532 [Saccostrea echinata]
MGCTCSTEAVPIVEIRRRRRTIKERIVSFFSRKNRPRENPDPHPQEETEEGTVSVNAQVGDIESDISQEENTSLPLCEIDPPLPTRTYSDVSVTDMIEIFEKSRTKKSVSSTTFTIKRNDSDSNLSCPKTPRDSQAGRGNVSSEKYSSDRESIDYKPPLEKPNPEKKLNFHYPCYRVKTSNVEKSPNVDICIGAIASEENISETAETSEIGTSQKTNSGIFAKNNAYEAANKSYSYTSTARDLKQESAKAWDSGNDSQRSAFENAGTSTSGHASTGHDNDTPKDASAGPSTWTSTKMYGNSRQQTAKEIEMALLAAENKPIHRPSYLIDTRVINVRPKAAKGNRKPPDVYQSSAPTLTYTNNSLQSRMRDFNRDVDRLFESQPQQTQPSQKPYNINKRPKAARGVRSLQTTDICGNTSGFSSGSYSLRPQLTMPGLRLPEQDALEKFMLSQRTKEEQRTQGKDKNLVSTKHH